MIYTDTWVKNIDCTIVRLFIAALIIHCVGITQCIADTSSQPTSVSNQAITPVVKSTPEDSNLFRDPLSPVLLTAKEYLVDACVFEQIAKDPIDASNRIKVGADPSGKGVQVLMLAQWPRDNPYSQLGFEQGHLITHVGSTATNDPNTFWSSLKLAPPKGVIEVTTLKGNTSTILRFTVRTDSDSRRCLTLRPGEGYQQSRELDMTSPQKHSVLKTELGAGLSNLPLTLSQARAVPYFKNGSSVGMRLFAIRRSSLYEKLGFANGDILKSIEGLQVADPADALRMFNVLNEKNEVKVVIERGGIEIELQLSVKSP